MIKKLLKIAILIASSAISVSFAATDFTISTNTIVLTENNANTIRNQVNITDITDTNNGGNNASFTVTVSGDDIFTTNPAPVVSFSDNSIISVATLTSTAQTATLYFTIIPDTTGTSEISITLTDTSGNVITKIVTVMIGESDNSPVITNEFDSRLQNISVYGGHLYAYSAITANNENNNAYKIINTELGGHFAAINSIEEQNFLEGVMANGWEALVSTANLSNHTYPFNLVLETNTDSTPHSVVNSAGNYTIYPGLYDFTNWSTGGGITSAVHPASEYAYGATLRKIRSFLFGEEVNFGIRNSRHEFPNGFTALTQKSFTLNQAAALTEVVTLSGFDLDGDSITWSYSDSADGTATFTNNAANTGVSSTTVYYQPAADFIGTTTLDIILTDDNNNSSTMAINVTVELIAPNIAFSPNAVIANVGAYTTITPSNSGGAVAFYSISPAFSNGLSFATDTGTISGTPTVKSSLMTHTIIATNTKGTASATIDITVKSAAPTGVTLSSYNINENSNIGTVIGLLSTQDLDGTHAYTLNDNNDYFKISDNSPFALISKVRFNHETRSSYTISITTTDEEGNSYRQDGIEIVINDITTGDSAPYAIYISDVGAQQTKTVTTTDENIPPGIIGVLTTADADDSNNTYTYTYTLNNNTASFTIDNNSLNSSVEFDFETQSSYIISISTVDIDGNTFSQTLTININDIADIPEIASLSAQVYTANIAITNDLIFENTSIVNLDSCESNPPLPAGLLLDKNFNDCKISGKPATYSDATDYTITATNQYGSGTATVNITVNPTEPTGINLSPNSIHENNVAGATVGIFSTDDIDNGTHTYTFTNNYFEFGVTANQSGNFNNTYNNNFILRDIDGATHTIAAITFANVSSTNNPASKTATAINAMTNVTGVSASAITDGNASGTVRLTAWPDNFNGAELIGFSIISGEIGIAVDAGKTIDVDEQFFSIDADKLIADVAFNFEQRRSYNIDISTTDERGSAFSQSFSITILNRDDIPEKITLSSSSVAENSITVIGVLSTTDLNNLPGETHTYTINNTFNFAVAGEDVSDTANISNNFILRDINGKQYIIATINNYSANDDSAAAFLVAAINAETVITQISATNTGTTVRINYPDKFIGATLLSSSGTGTADYIKITSTTTLTANQRLFSISGSNLSSAIKLDFETQSSHIINISTIDVDNNTYSQDIKVSIEDVDDVPILTNQSAQIYVINTPTTLTFTTNSATNNAVSLDSCEITPDLPAGLGIVVVNTACEISGTPSAVSSATTYTITAINTAGSDTATVNITVDPDAPNISLSIPGPVTFVAGTQIIPITVSNSGGTATLHSINPAFTNGLSFSTATGTISGEPIAFHSAITYTITATNITGSSTAIINIAVNVSTAPDITLVPATLSASLGLPISGITVVNIGGAANSYSIAPSLSDGLSFDDNDGSISGTPNVTATAQVYTVTATNPIGTNAATVTITISGHNPTGVRINGSTTASINENTATGTAIGTLSTVDLDGGDFSYELVNDNHFEFLVYADPNNNGLNDFIVRDVNGVDHTIATIDFVNFNSSSDPAEKLAIAINNYSQTHNTGIVAGYQNYSGYGNVIIRFWPNNLNGALLVGFSLPDDDISIDGVTLRFPTIDEPFFSIDNDVLKSNAVFDYEGKNVYNIKVRTTDQNNNSYKETLRININDVNDAPTAITLSPDSIAENNNIEDTVGTFLTTDPNFGTHTYKLPATVAELKLTVRNNFGNYVAGNRDFVIEDVNGATHTIATLNFNNENSFRHPANKLIAAINNYDDANETGVRASTSRKLSEVNFGTVNIISWPYNLNGAQFIGFTLNGNNGILVASGQSIPADDEPFSSVPFSIETGTDVLKSKIVFDYEERASYTINVTTTDEDGNSYTQDVIVYIDNVADVPELADKLPQVYEVNVEIEKLIFADTALIDLIDCSASLPAGLSIEISADKYACEVSGIPTTLSGATDYTITATNTNGSDTAIVNITISASVPKGITLSPDSINENNQIGAIIGTLSTDDNDNATHTYTLTNNYFDFVVASQSGSNINNDNKFILTDIYGATHTIATINFNTPDSAQFPASKTATAINAMNVASNTGVVASVTGVNSIDTGTVRLNSWPDNLNLATLNGFTAKNNNNQDLHIIKIVSTKTLTLDIDEQFFSINNSSATLIADVAFNYEEKGSYTINITTADETATFSQDITIYIGNDPNDVPTKINITNDTIAENQPAGIVGLFSTIDGGGGTYAYTLLDNTAIFYIDENNNLNSKVSFDYEERGSYTINVSVTDEDRNTFSQSIIIYIRNLDDSPIFADEPAQTYTEDQAISDLIFINTNTTGGQLTSCEVNPTLPTGLSIAISNLDDCKISGTPTQVIAATYTITARNTAGNGTATVSITVNPANPDIFISTTGFGAEVGTAITDVTISSNAGGGAVASYSISPTLNNGLSFSTTTGTISGVPRAVQDIIWTITATNVTGTDSVTVHITISLSAPNIAFSPNNIIAVVGTPIVDITVLSFAGTATLYAISDTPSAGLSFNTETGIISGTPSATKPLTVYTITATNSVEGSGVATLSITVNPKVPNISLSTTTITATARSAISDITVTNSGGDATYSISPAIANDLSFDITNGTISGTPANAATNVVYTITATNVTGTDSATISITVNPAAPNISLSVSTLTATAETAISNITVTNSGGSATYSISPAIANNLSFDTTDGTISGIPANAATNIVYTITATNVTNSDSVTLSITVNPAAPSIELSVATINAGIGKVIEPITVINNGGTPTSYAISDTLSAGLSFSTKTGTISGTPSATATAIIYTVTATNITDTDSATVTITVNEIIDPPSIANIEGTQTYYAGVMISPVEFTNSGDPAQSCASNIALPAGLNVAVSGNSCAISGTPTMVSAATTYTITATNLIGSDTATINISVTFATPSISVSVTAITAIVGNAINITVSNDGGTATYSILPAIANNLSFNTTDGTISGMPIATATLQVYTITASNVTGTDSATLSITVHPASPDISLSVSTLTATAGSAISNITVINNGGTATYSISPAIANNLSFDTTDGTISGTPANAATNVIYTITASNISGSSTATVEITVNPAAPDISLSTTTITATAGRAISNITVTNSGGTATSYAISPALNVGLSFSTETGTISGTPANAATNAQWTITASNISGNSTATLNITVNPKAPNISLSTTTITAVVGIYVDISATNTGGVADLYSIAPAIANNLSFNDATGSISGTPSASATAMIYTITATNVTNSDSATLSITVNAAIAFSLDIDGNGTVNAPNDGLIIFKYLLNSNANNLHTTIDTDAIEGRKTSAQLKAYLDNAGTILDADGNGTINAPNDGLIIFKYLLNSNANNLHTTIDTDAIEGRKTSAQLKAYLDKYR